MRQLVTKKACFVSKELFTAPARILRLPQPDDFGLTEMRRPFIA
jgi:hypothetical protein